MSVSSPPKSTTITLRSGSPPPAVPKTKEHTVVHIEAPCESFVSPIMKEILDEIYFSHCYTREELVEILTPTNKGVLFTPFQLEPEFFEKYIGREPKFGFNGLGKVTFMRTYSRVIENDDGSLKKEMWSDTIKRVVEGTMNSMKRHVYSIQGHWNDRKGQKLAQTFFELMWNMKFLPPGRGLWAMGSPITENVGFNTALNNCAFVSTKDIKERGATIFAWFMDLSMMGCGVGFDTRGAEGDPETERQQIYSPSEDNPEHFIVGDTREGWVSSTAALLHSYFTPGSKSIFFSYDNIRPRGERLKTFGGIAPGPEPLRELHKALRDIFEKKLASSNEKEPVYLGIRDIVDIFNLIGVCVVSGNVRRTAEIAFGPHDSKEFIELKDYGKNPERGSFGWTSNNSIFGKIGMDYSEIAKNIYKNGEPGVMWLDNARDNGRMSGKAYDKKKKDSAAMGGNPCLEQTLHSKELCNVVEMFMNMIKTLEEAVIVCKYAYLYAKIVSLLPVHWKDSKEVMFKNRRLGVSMTGIMQFISKHGRKQFINTCEACYDEIQYQDNVYSAYFSVPESIKTTSVKPSGTVALLGGASPGVHPHLFKQYIRRITLDKGSELIDPLREAGYNIVNSPYDAKSCLVEFPIRIEDDSVSQHDMGMYEMLELVALLQRVWADNQVSATVAFDPKKVSKEDIAAALSRYQYILKGISFLPLGPIGQYALPPYEPIDDAEYEKRAAAIKEINFDDIQPMYPEAPKGCTSDSCVL